MKKQTIEASYLKGKKIKATELTVQLAKAKSQIEKGTLILVVFILNPSLEARCFICIIPEKL